MCVLVIDLLPRSSGLAAGPRRAEAWALGSASGKGLWGGDYPVNTAMIRSLEPWVYPFIKFRAIHFRTTGVSQDGVGATGTARRLRLVTRRLPTVCFEKVSPTLRNGQTCDTLDENLH